MNEEKTQNTDDTPSVNSVGFSELLANGVKFPYWKSENAYLAKYVGDDDHYGAEQLKGGSWVPVVYQDDGWQADYVDGVYGEFEEAVQAAWDHLS